MTTFPELGTSREVLQRALSAIGITNVNEALDALVKTPESSREVALAKVLKRFKEVLGDNVS